VVVLAGLSTKRGGGRRRNHALQRLVLGSGRCRRSLRDISSTSVPTVVVTVSAQGPTSWRGLGRVGSFSGGLTIFPRWRIFVDQRVVGLPSQLGGFARGGVWMPVSLPSRGPANPTSHNARNSREILRSGRATPHKLGIPALPGRHASLTAIAPSDHESSMAQRGFLNIVPVGFLIWLLQLVSMGRSLVSAPASGLEFRASGMAGRGVPPGDTWPTRRVAKLSHDRPPQDCQRLLAGPRSDAKPARALFSGNFQPPVQRPRPGTTLTPQCSLWWLPTESRAPRPGRVGTPGGRPGSSTGSWSKPRADRAGETGGRPARARRRKPFTCSSGCTRNGAYQLAVRRAGGGTSVRPGWALGGLASRSTLWVNRSGRPEPFRAPPSRTLSSLATLTSGVG
jgi:hypothetical protein